MITNLKTWLADLITGDDYSWRAVELTGWRGQAKRAVEEKELAQKDANDMALLNDIFRKALQDIAAMETPRSGAQSKAMAKIARDALNEF